MTKPKPAVPSTPVRTVDMCVHITVFNCVIYSTVLNSGQNLPSYRPGSE